jgi:hypothetical protein
MDNADITTEEEEAVGDGRVKRRVLPPSHREHAGRTLGRALTANKSSMITVSIAVT